MTQGLAVFDEAGHELYDEGTSMGWLGAVDAAPLVYTPNLADVGHGASYSPGSIAGDAHALNFLGFLADAALTAIPDTSGNVQKDLAQGLGAFDPDFKAAVSAFQAANGDSVDGFIGPQTRTTLAVKVAAKNLASVPTAPPFIVPGNPVAPGVPPGVLPNPGGQPVPPVQPGPAPAAQAAGMSPVMIGALVVGGAVLLGGLYYALSD